MKVLIDQLFVDWDELETPEEYKILKKYASNGRRYSLGYSCKNKPFIFMLSCFDYKIIIYLSLVKRFICMRCSVLLFRRICIHIHVPRTASVGCCFTSQRISSYAASLSRILLYWWEEIFLLYFLACHDGLGNCCDCDSLPRLHALDLHRTCLQYFHTRRVRTKIA
jgi:hypothetical protein